MCIRDRDSSWHRINVEVSVSDDSDTGSVITVLGKVEQTLLTTLLWVLTLCFPIALVWFVPLAWMVFVILLVALLWSRLRAVRTFEEMVQSALNTL